MIYSRNNDDDTRAGRKTPSSFLPYGDMVRVRCLPFSFSSLFLPDPLQLTARNSLPLDYILLHGENTKKEEKKNLVRYITSPHLSQSITKSHQSGIGEKRIFFTFRFPPFFCLFLSLNCVKTIVILPGDIKTKEKKETLPAICPSPCPNEDPLFHPISPTFFPSLPFFAFISSRTDTPPPAHVAGSKVKETLCVLNSFRSRTIISWRI